MEPKMNITSDLNLHLPRSRKFWYGLAGAIIIATSFNYCTTEHCPVCGEAPVTSWVYATERESGTVFKDQSNHKWVKRAK